MEPDLRIDSLTKVVRAGLKCRIFGGDSEWESVLPRDVYEKVQPIFYAWRRLPAGALCRQNWHLLLQ